jgi:F0F1-type ATP synthase assembly protein I
MSDEREISQQQSEKNRGLKDYVKAEQMVQLALALPAGCLIGWGIGAWLDRHFHQGWISIAGIVVGAIGGFIQIFTTAARYLKDNR